jgi:hypothetical protein
MDIISVTPIQAVGPLVGPSSNKDFRSQENYSKIFQAKVTQLRLSISQGFEHNDSATISAWFMAATGVKCRDCIVFTASWVNCARCAT